MAGDRLHRYEAAEAQERHIWPADPGRNKLGPEGDEQHYRQSVPAIFVKKGQDEFTGTGFLATNKANATKHVIVTVKHNVDPTEGITFSGFGSPDGVSYRTLVQAWILHPSVDLAAMPGSSRGSGAAGKRLRGYHRLRRPVPPTTTAACRQKTRKAGYKPALLLHSTFGTPPFVSMEAPRVRLSLYIPYLRGVSSRLLPSRRPLGGGP